MKRFLCALLCQLVWLGSAKSSASAEVSGEVNPDKCFVVATANNDTHVKELVRHVYRMTGVVIKTGDADQIENHTHVFLLGNAEFNPLVKELKETDVLFVDWKGLGAEGFGIRSFNHEGCDYLLIAGTTPRTTSYGVAEYLERLCGIGFFIDGSFIPGRESIPFRDIDMTERPRFSVRFWNSDTGHWGLKKFQSGFWNAQRWLRQLDWMEKRKLNLALMPLNPNMDLARGSVVRAFDVDEPPVRARLLGGWPAGWAWPAGYRDYVTRTALEFGRERGIKFISGSGIG